MHIPSDTLLASSSLVDSSGSAASVICSWPLSGQYGPGARMLYYVLVIICVAAPHIAWMRGACLAAALLFPSVAAIHALVLASVSETHGAVDLDIFGTFQLCSIGVLAVPITVRYSKTYFETKGRNLVFAWMVLNLAGLLSLIVAFYRASPQTCLDDQKNIVTVSAFMNATAGGSSQTVCHPQCNLITTIRQDPSNPSQWVFAPSRGMTFNTATLLCAACCIPSILSLLSVWHKVMQFNFRRRWRRGNTNVAEGIANEKNPQPGLTQEERDEQVLRADERWMDKRIRLVLGLVERIVFIVCILAIVVLGEMNFWSPQMRAGVEHINGVGQWGPIVGAALAAFGSFFAVLSRPSSNPEDDDSLPSTPEGDGAGQPGPASEAGPAPGPGHRAKVNRGVFKVLKALGTPGADRFTNEERTNKFREFPVVPGERARNPTLGHQIAQFDQRRQTLTQARSFTNGGPRQDGDDGVNDTNGPHRRGGPPRDTGTGTPPSRIDSGAHLSQRRVPHSTLQIPKRIYTSPREAPTIPSLRDDIDSPVRAPGVPRIVIDAETPT